MHILHVVGARPNFVKAAPILRVLKDKGMRQTLVHTGQHYDRNMSDVFFAQLEIPEPDVNLGVGSGSHASQTAEIMCRIEPVLLERKPDIVLVYGDVNSTVAAALVCSKLLIRLGHVEAGLRSFDRTMPEEINRIVTDRLSDYLFTPSEDGDLNLQNEGVAADKIHRVGNVMIDSLVRFLPLAAKCLKNEWPGGFALVTLHRPSNVDDQRNLESILGSLIEVSDELDIVFPVHPRTRQRIADFKTATHKLHLLDPMPYLEFLALQSRATVVITDSGGIQEETTYLGIPCLTLRSNTERPVTVTVGTNILVGEDKHKLTSELENILAGKGKKGAIPPLWDGHASERIFAVLQGLG
ncbi:MAG TPA: UDP-N-acetylglucosamine 2-epimerase (non-hydrolyzing) [Terriglobales bacterium]|nr:UDP-N-acetylglucosamine 2-epimerase (non-hydrolyzing) [Terriglobales bacterium]